MIIDLQRYIHEERATWQELETELQRLENEPSARLSLAQVKRLHYLYQRASSGLARIETYAAEPETRRYLEGLVARAYAECHEERTGALRFHPLEWFRTTFPQTVRRHHRALALAIAITLVGSVFGGLALTLDPDAKPVLIGFDHLTGSPTERVQEEEGASDDRLAGRKAQFSAYLMTHNIKVSLFAMGLGMTWGIGTLVLLFYNGVILGAVSADYLLSGEGAFLVGWLLPHGSIEIPAIVLAGQAGLLLGGALLGWGQPLSLAARMRRLLPDLSTLIGGVAVMLVWAGLIEAFFSQYHEPVIPYTVKILFGLTQLVLLIFFLMSAGKAERRVSRAL